MQELVGGRIELLYPFEDHIALISNEEGKLLELPMNRALTTENDEVYDVISGNFFLVGAPPDSENFASLSEEQMVKMKERFEYPEIFIWNGTKTIVLRDYG